MKKYISVLIGLYFAAALIVILLRLLKFVQKRGSFTPTERKLGEPMAGMELETVYLFLWKDSSAREVSETPGDELGDDVTYLLV